VSVGGGKMNFNEIKSSISYCGLVCCFCKVKDNCDCKTDNHCCKRLSSDGCYQYDCCRGKGLNGCWECPDSPCDKGIFANNSLKPSVFVKCIKEDGVEKFTHYMLRNHQNGIAYTTNAHGDDYDLDSEKDILNLLRNGIIVENCARL